MLFHDHYRSDCCVVNVTTTLLQLLLNLFFFIACNYCLKQVDWSVVGHEACCKAILQNVSLKIAFFGSTYLCISTFLCTMMANRPIHSFKKSLSLNELLRFISFGYLKIWTDDVKSVFDTEIIL